MRTRVWPVLLSLVLAACASPGARPAGSLTAAEQFDRIKTLEGAWVSTAESAMQGRTTFTIVAAGSAVMERLFEGQPHEMVTMYHLDGDELVLTHYCAAQNQPTMRAVAGGDPAEISFEFVSLGNGDPEKGMHMHEAVLRFSDDGHFRPTWTGYEDGQPSEHVAAMDFVREE